MRTKLRKTPTLILAAALLGVGAAQAAPERMNKPYAHPYWNDYIRVDWGQAEVGPDGVRLKGYCVRWKTDSSWSEADCRTNRAERWRVNHVEHHVTYYYQVAAQDDHGERGAWSPSSSGMEARSQ